MKQNKTSRVGAILLSICMLLVSCIGGYVETKAQEITEISFLNSEKWEQVYAYVWGDSEALGAWPGTKVEKESADWYKISVPRGVGFNIIFNNGNGSQAGNVYITDTTNVYVTMNADAKYSSKTEAENAMGYVSTTTRVYFYNSENWTSVSAYVYGLKEALGTWPGSAALADGDGWYYIDVPMAAAEGFNIIFNDNNNGNQAGDVYITDSENVYLTMAADTKYASKEAALAGSNQGGQTETGEEGSGDTGTNSDIKYDVDLSGVGAKLSYIEIEAEEADTNGEILSKSIAYRSDIQSEASKRSAVKLDATGEYVEFTLPEAANAMVLRYCIPDGNNGAGIEASLSMYVNGTQLQDMSLTSKYAWVYGEYPFYNNPSAGNGHRFFDEARILFGQTYPEGTKIRLQKDSGDNAGYYIIDLADFEQVGAAITQPDGYLSITDFGAKADDNQDDYQAIVNCIDKAKAQGKGVYIPAGTFHVNTKQVIDVNGVTIKGAGMWYSTLYGAGAAFKISGNCQFSDFAMTGVSTVRDDGGDLAGFEGYEASSDVTIQNIWMEHMKVGCWFYNSSRLTIQGCRIRNTYADGINLCSNVNDAVVQNNHLRNTGDDSIAIWPWQADSNRNVIQYNTIQVPSLANGIAVYGGADNKVLNNYITDNVAFGAGINISTNFDSPNGFSGVTTVTGNVLERCGSYEHNWNYARGAIWMFASMKPITAGVVFSNNTVYDSSYSGITLEGGYEISNVRFTDNKFYGMNEYAVHVRGSVPGQAVFENHLVANVGKTLVEKESAQFTVTESNGGIFVGSMPENSGDEGTGESTGESTDESTGDEGGNTDGGSTGEDNEENVGDDNTGDNKDGEVGVKLYQDISYGGYEVVLWEGEYTLAQLQKLGMKNDDISSLKVPFGYRVTLYKDNDFKGDTKVLTEDLSWIGSDFNDVVSSVVVEKVQYRIVSRHSGLCLDIAGGNTEDGANVIQWFANGLSCQTWEVTPLTDGTYVITSIMNDKSLDVAGWATENGGNIQVWTYLGQDNQKWWLNDAGDGYCSIISKYTNKAVDVSEWSTQGAANIHQWDYFEQANQQWKFEAVN